MKRLQLDNFILEEYNDSNVEHKAAIKELDNENSFLGSVTRSIEKLNNEKEEKKLNQDCAYVAYYENHPIGFISISTSKDKYVIRYGILPIYRKKHLGFLLLQQFSNKMFEQPNIDELTLFINNTNTASKKIANLVGYEQITNVRYEKHK